jgi:serine/threonine-protein kinase
MIGTSLGPYRVIGRLGEGGMGEVYRARDTKLNRDVALKILPAAFAADADRLARFEREAQVLAALNHPNIAQIHGLEERALVMELVDGQDLSQLVARGPLQVSDAIAIARQIADALEAAHDLGIVHRDLKPANVKVTDDGTVKVLDFGLAKVMTPESGPGTSDPQNSPTLTARATQLGVVLGTAAYMAPEQARGRPVDKRADIWAFGCVLFEMLSGQRAFRGDDVSETLASVLRQDVEWAGLPPSTPATVRRLLGRCLERDVKMRLRDIGEARVALAAPDDSPAAQVPAAHPVTRRTWLVGSAAAIMAGALGWWVANWSRSPVTVSVPVYSQLVLAEIFEERPNFRSMAFTPDGRSLVFVGGNRLKHQLYRRQLDKEQALPIAGTEGADAPFVSTDGLWVGFTADGAIKKAPLGGGAAETIHDLRKSGTADAVATGWGGQDHAYGATWLSDGTIVYGRFTGGLWQVSSEGGAPKPITSLDSSTGEFAHRLPQVLPGGQAIIFSVQRGIRAGGPIDAVDLPSGRRTRLIDDGTDARFVESGHLLFARAGALFAIRFDPAALRTDGEAVRVLSGVMHAVGGTTPGQATGAAQFDMSSTGTLVFLPGGVLAAPSMQVVWVSRGGKVEPIDLEPLPYFAPMVSPDGREIAVSAIRPGDSGDTLFNVDVARGLLTPIIRGAAWPLWTPDGSRLIVKMKGPRSENALFSLSLAGAAMPELVAESEHLLWPSSISADGKWLAYVETHPQTGNDIWVIGLTPGVAARAVLNTTADESFPAVSPDGRWLAYSIGDTGPGALYVRPFPGPGRPERISKADGRSPVWARDGKTLFYRAANQILAAHVDTSGQAIQIGTPEVFAEGPFAGTTPVGGLSLAPDGRIVMRRSNRSPAPSPGDVRRQPAAQYRIIANAWPLLTGAK